MKKIIWVLVFLMLAAFSLTAQSILDDGVKDAVDKLSSTLARQRAVRIGAIIVDRTKDVTTELSAVLHNKVKQFASENRLFMVVVVRGPVKDEPTTGVIAGKYSIVGKTVEVYLTLTIGDQIRTQVIKIPVAELERLGVAYLPDNFNTLDDIIKDDIIETLAETNKPPLTVTNKPPALQKQTINIEAWFDSKAGSKLYMHRDELKMEVKSDRDCYFKVIHVDAEDKMKMIYPNSSERNNFLKANTSRALFETVRYMLYGPYGAETIVVVASSEQFKDIEKEYIAPWTTATAESLQSAIRGTRGTRGGDLEAGTETGAAEGMAKYTITILKPHEEYAYNRPPDLAAAIRGMREDIERQGGIFSGNDVSGWYILNNIRTSYRVPREAPESMQFATYFLDRLEGNPEAAPKTRGSGHSFSFAKPAQVNQAIQTVRKEITGSGGRFTGNEQEGSFRVSGIEGYYRISNLVSVTITSKPFIVSNSYIEKEIKNYFSK